MGWSGRLEELREVVASKPAHPIVSSPELARFVDINLAGLLTVRLSKFLADAKSVKSGHENASLAAEIGSAGKPQCRCKVHLRPVEEMTMRVATEV